MAEDIGSTQIEDSIWTLIQMFCLLHSSPAAGLFVSKGTGRGPETENTPPSWSKNMLDPESIHSNTILCLSTHVLIPKEQDK